MLIQTLHGLAIAAGWLNGLPLIYRILALVIVAFSLLRCLKSVALAPLYLRYTQPQGWSMAVGDDNFRPMIMLSSTVVTRWLIVLHFQTGEKAHHTRLIFGDSMSADAYRRLRMQLKISGSDQDR